MLTHECGTEPEQRPGRTTLHGKSILKVIQNVTKKLTKTCCGCLPARRLDPVAVG